MYFGFTFNFFYYLTEIRDYLSVLLIVVLTDFGNSTCLIPSEQFCYVNKTNINYDL